MFKFLIIVLFVYFPTALLSANIISTDFKPVKTHQIQASNDYAIFSLLTKEARQILFNNPDEIKISNFPISITNTGNIIITPVRDIIKSETQWYRNTKSGIIEASAPEIKSFIGIIENQPESKVYLNFVEGNLYSIIKIDEHSSYEIAPVNSKLNPKQNDEHIIQEVEWDKFKEDINQFCATPELNNELEEIRAWKYSKAEIQALKLIELPIAAEGEYFFFQQMGSDYMRAAAYIANVMALSSLIYEEFSAVGFYLSYVVIQEDSSKCPYVNREDLADKLWRMPNAWKGRTATRAIAVLFANLLKQPAGNIIAGISMGGQAYKGSLCNSNNGYCVFGIRGGYKYPTTNYTWDINVATHEMGHNFGLPHTHGCFWRPNMIDTCITDSKPYESDGCVTVGEPIPRPGTIMSYCHLTNSTHSVQLVFHPRELPLIRTAAEKAACAKQSTNPIVKLLAPHGEEEFVGGSSIQIRWISSNVNFINLKFSSDNGVSWSDIAIKYPIKDTIYNWRLPEVFTNQGLILIQDFYNPSTKDSSKIPFKIISKMLSILKPQTDERFGQNERITINWEKSLVDEVNILFSDNAGQTWSVISENNPGFSYDWDVPDILSDQCIIRIVNSQDNSHISQSGLFAIGKEQVAIIFPKGGERFCIGDTYSIKWESDFLNRIFIEYSTDKGENWKKIRITPIDAKIGEIEWKIPNRISSDTYLRIVSTAAPDIDLAKLDNSFEMDSCILGTTESQDEDFKFELVPNPSSGNIKVKYYSQSTLPAQLTISDATGSLHFNKLFQLTSGLNELNLELGSIPSGVYYIIIRQSFDIRTQIFTIIK